MSLSSPSGDHRSWRTAIAIAAAWAMIASASEFMTHLVTRYAGNPVYQSIDVVWAKPLVNLLLFLPAALVLRLLPAPLFIAGLAFPAVAATLLLIRPGSPVPMIILAAGIGTQLGVMLAAPRRQAATIRVGRALAVVFAVAAVATQGARSVGERERHVTQASPDAPNVLLIILDTVRAASLSLYGGRAGTPALDSLAAEGVAYDRAVSTAPWTLPAHASMFTGLWPHEHGADWRAPLDRRAPTLAEVLSRHGYRTGGFAANLVFTSREHGLHRGFRVYRDYRRSPGALLRSSALVQTVTTSKYLRRLTGFHEVTGRKRGVHVNREFLDWEGNSGGRPWFAFLNYYDAHEPYLPRAPYAGRYSPGLPSRRFDLQRFWHVEGMLDDWKALSPGEVDAERAAYEEAITGLDADVGALLSELRRRGVLDRTIVVITSDHGELFGEHAAFAHGNSIYWRTLHVPLVIAWPGHLAPGRVTETISLRDLPATILSLAFPGQPAELPGNPLPLEPGVAARTLPLSELATDEFTADEPPMRNGALQSVAGATWQYIRAANGHEEVYWTGTGVAQVDTLVSAPAVRSAIIDSARAQLGAASVPAPRDSSR